MFGFRPGVYFQISFGKTTFIQNNRFMSGTSVGPFNRTFDHLSQYDREVSVELSQGVVVWAAMSLRQTNSDRA